jgi:hypothetical protein
MIIPSIELVRGAVVTCGGAPADPLAGALEQTPGARLGTLAVLPGTRDAAAALGVARTAAGAWAGQHVSVWALLGDAVASDDASAGDGDDASAGDGDNASAGNGDNAAGQDAGQAAARDRAVARMREALDAGCAVVGVSMKVASRTLMIAGVPWEDDEDEDADGGADAWVHDRYIVAQKGCARGARVLFWHC